MRTGSPEQRVSSKKIYHGRILNLRVDAIRIPDGSQHIREVVEHAPAVAMIPMLSADQVVLVRQYRYAIGQYLWELPAGLMAKRETPLAAAKRELAEETGFQARHWKLISAFYSSPGFSREKIHLFLARGLFGKGPTQFDPDEFLTSQVFTLKKALLLVKQGVIQDGKTVLGLTIAAQRIGW